MFLLFSPQVIGKIKRTPGSSKGAEILGVHVEGPFINTNKKGAHDTKYIKKFDNVRYFYTALSVANNLYVN